MPREHTACQDRPLAQPARVANIAPQQVLYRRPVHRGRWLALIRRVVLHALLDIHARLLPSLRHNAPLPNSILHQLAQLNALAALLETLALQLRLLLALELESTHPSVLVSANLVRRAILHQVPLFHKSNVQAALTLVPLAKQVATNATQAKLALTR